MEHASSALPDFPPSRPEVVLLCGPSCSGKTPLRRAVDALYPALGQRLTNLVLYTSRDRRPVEREGVEYYFRTREEIGELCHRSELIPIVVRRDLLALDVSQLRGLRHRGCTAFWEGNPAVLQSMESAGVLEGLRVLKLFMSPLAAEEIRFLTAPERGVDLRAFVTALMERKLLARTRRQYGTLSVRRLEDLQVRAGTAYDELRIAWQFEAVLPNHDGEDSEHWSDVPVSRGDARRAVDAFARLVQGQPCSWVEHWDRDLVP